MLPRALLILAALLAWNAHAGEAALSVDVPAGQSKSVRLRNLPSGTLLQVDINSSGKVLVALVSAKQLKSAAPQAVFRGVIDRRMSFKVVVPESSDYYLILNNKQGNETLNIQTGIRAEKRQPAPAPPQKREKMHDAGLLLPAA